MEITIIQKDKKQQTLRIKLEVYSPKIALCHHTTIGKYWNKTQSKTNNGVYTTFIRKPENNLRYKMLDMAAFCMENDISPDMLKLAVNHIKEVAALLDSKESKPYNKIVIMSEEDYESYELFKKMKAFNEAQK
jgi:hypothetical protein